MKKSIYLFAIAGMLFTGSCSKSFLQIDPQQQTDVELVIKDLPTTRAAITGTYNLMQSAGLYGRNAMVLPDVMSDNVFISSKNQGRFLSYDQYITVATEGYAASLWNQLYRVVVNANIIIRKAEANNYADADKAEAQFIIGEAYALRALAYFDLMRFFALPYNYTADASHLGVPLVLKSGTDKNEVISPKRNTAKEVYTQIVADFNTAMSLMPKTPVGFKASFRGRVSYYGAKALLSRVQLYREDWEAVDSLATDVIKNGGFSLLTRTAMFEDSKKQNSSEAIFEIQFNQTDNLGSDALANFYWQSGSYGDGLATENLYSTYTATDARRGFVVKGSRKSGENPAWLINKYTNNTTFEEPSRIIRLAEVYLNRAEARAHKNQDGLAAADLDVVGGRADADYKPATATGDPLKALILLERRKELAFEGHRLFDLTRNKQSFTKYRSSKTIQIDYPNLKTILPIPQAEMNSNRNMEQNDAYKIQ
ncbi:RagB/SusD family nutrient uptake outer membrane protein [Chitinophaga silvatica]|uniref:RagB/SusD family nutrient uptake outer membrane protein n=1 Tax=Chitinophaga silvatica TaxID=2282649 RepID=A0A3E1Y2M5_9BACT|nr:RagB/SusD family nutrient uptake outer membrane protein [Chitinophaga silvatica]RFS18903.1 RagB/SusD family nutrient uptake outer membrane protein [Chitinophaga silvatica]